MNQNHIPNHEWTSVLRKSGIVVLVLGVLSMCFLPFIEEVKLHCNSGSEASSKQELASLSFFIGG